MPQVRVHEDQADQSDQMANPSSGPGWLPPEFKHIAAEIGEIKDYGSSKLLDIVDHKN